MAKIYNRLISIIVKYPKTLFAVEMSLKYLLNVSKIQFKTAKSMPVASITKII